MVLSHRAGLAAIDGELSLDDVLAWHPVIAAIAAQAPNWEPGSTHGYHARSFGWILGEIIRRITGESPGAHLQRTIAGPLGLDYWVGLPGREMALGVPGLHWHDYGKSPRPGRKLGHCTLIEGTAAGRDRRLRALLPRLAPDVRLSFPGSG